MTAGLPNRHFGCEEFAAWIPGEMAGLPGREIEAGLRYRSRK
jgi:hypothetical protein